MPKEYTVPLVERKLGIGVILDQHLHVLLQSLRVFVQPISAHLLNVDEHFRFVLKRDNAHVLCLPALWLSVVTIVLMVLLLLFAGFRLDKNHHVAVVLDKTQVGQPSVRLILGKVSHYAVCTFAHCCAEKLVLLRPEGVCSLKLDLEREFVCIIIQVDESIIQQEASVAFLAVRVIDLFATLYILQSVNHEATPFVAILPGGLPWASMVQHVCVGNEGIGLVLVD